MLTFVTLDGNRLSDGGEDKIVLYLPRLGARMISASVPAISFF